MNILVVPVTLLYIPACAVGGHQEDVTGLTLELDGGIGGSVPPPLSLGGSAHWSRPVVAGASRMKRVL